MPALLYLLALAVLAQGTSEFVLSGLLPHVAPDLGVPVGRAGLLTSGFAVGLLVGAPVMAVAVRRVAPRLALGGTLSVFVLTHAVGATTDDFTVLLTTRVLAALAYAGFLAVTLSLVTRLVPRPLQARALAVVLGGSTLALVAGVPTGVVVADVLGWRATLWAIAALCVPPLAGVLVAAPGRLGGDRDSTSVRPSVRAELACLREGPTRSSVLLAVLVNAATFASFTYLAVVATDRAGVPEGAVAALLAVFGAGACLGVVATGRLADRHWSRIVGLGGPALLTGWVTLAWVVEVPGALWCLAGVQGLLSFLIGSTLVTRVVTTASAAPTLGGAFATAALNAGAVLGPAVGGVALDLTGARGPLVVSAALSATAVVVWWGRAPREPR